MKLVEELEHPRCAMWPESVPSSMSFRLLCTLTPFSPLLQGDLGPNLSSCVGVL